MFLNTIGKTTPKTAPAASQPPQKSKTIQKIRRYYGPIKRAGKHFAIDPPFQRLKENEEKDGGDKKETPICAAVHQQAGPPQRTCTSW